jgi:hypothetical protein
VSALGSIYVLVVLFFAPWPALITRSTKEERRRWLWLGGGLLATQAWMTQPIPSWMGYPLLWHLVQPGRMVLAGGLLLLIFAFVLGQARPLRFSVSGCVAFSVTLLLAWALYKRPFGIGWREAYRDWIFAVPVAIVALLQAVKLLKPAGANAALIASAAALGVVSFGTFNPIQTTTPIFARHNTPVTENLNHRLATEGRGYLLLPWGTTFFAHAGMPLIGMGYPSIAYSTFDPAMDLWARVYPELPIDEQRRQFDNVGSFAFGDVPAPRWVPIITLAPMAPFIRPGATVCDFIRPSRREFAPLVGCQSQ